MKIIIILSILSSLLNDFFVKNIPSLGKITSLFSIILILVASINMLKEKKIVRYKKIYIILYLNIVFLFVQALFIKFNPYIIKLSIYIVAITILINYLDDNILSSLYSIIVLISIILSIDILIQGINLISSGVNLRNVRQYTLLDKQGYNMFYSFAIPITLVNFYYNKKIKNIIILIINIIASIFIMQIKSFFYTIPIGIIMALWILKKIRFKEVLALIGIIGISCVLTFNLVPSIIPKAIKVPIQYYILKDTGGIYDVDLRNLDTFEIRGQIWKNGMDALKNNYIIGIGYGNYAKLVENKKVVSNATGEIYSMPNVTESGLLTFILEGGIIGFLLHMLIIYCICLNTLKIKQYSKTCLISTIIFMIFIVSNIAQDNLNYLYWFVLGAQIYNTRNKHNSYEVRGV